MSTPTGRRTVTLTRALEHFVRDREREARLHTLDVALAEGIAEGIADAEAGRVTPAGEAFARIRAELGLDATTG